MEQTKKTAPYRVISDSGGRRVFRFFCDISGELCCVTRPIEADTEEAALEAPGVHAGAAREHALGEGFRAHFEGEHQDRVRAVVFALHRHAVDVLPERGGLEDGGGGDVQGNGPPLRRRRRPVRRPADGFQVPRREDHGAATPPTASSRPVARRRSVSVTASMGAEAPLISRKVS